MSDLGQTVDLDQIIVNEVAGTPGKPGLSFDPGGQLKVDSLDFNFVDLDFSFTVEAIDGARPFLYNELVITDFDLTAGELNGFAQTYVPVPATPLILLAGLGALAGVRRLRATGQASP